MKRISFCCFVSLLFLVGCGGHRNNPNRTLPSSFSLNAFRPNYGHDLDDAFWWEQPTVTYRFPAPGTATDIRLIPIQTVALSDREKQDARDGFTKWSVASESRVTFREVAPGEAANIDVIVQDSDSFRDGQYGENTPYLKDVSRGILGRCVIRIKNGLSERRARHVLLHEVGHACGLQGHDRQYGAVMYPTSPEIIPLIELSLRDRNTIQANYTR